MTKKRTRIAALIACTLIFGASCTLLDSANYCKVSFNTNGGNRIKSQKVKIGETVEKPDDPTRDGYEFDAWHYGKNMFDFSTPITEDITLNAYWTFRKADDTPQDGTPSGDGNPEDDKPGNGSGNPEEGDGTGDSTPPGDDNPGDETGNGSGNPEEGDGTGDSGNTDKDDENNTVSYDVYAEDVENTDFTREAYGTTYTLRLLDKWTDDDLAKFGEKIAAITERSVTLDMAEAIITTIGDETFKECASLAGIVIGNGVTTIGNQAFYNCAKLASVVIGNGVENIGNHAFSLCKALASIAIPNSVTSIGIQAFDGCSALASITIGNGVKSIGARTFYNCTALEDITIPDSVTDIDNNAFLGCTELKTVTLGAGWVGKTTFSKTTNALTPFTSCKEVIIGDGATKIGDYAFYYCDKLASVTIPASVTSIGTSAFEKCTSLASITIPDGVTEISASAFEGCDKLKTVTLGAKWVGENYEGSANALTPFSACTVVIIGDGAPEIGDYAFLGCKSLEDITIPDSVTSIGKQAFRNCESLETITFKGTAGQWGTITRGSDWHANVTKTTEVTCTGGNTNEKVGLDYISADND